MPIFQLLDDTHLFPHPEFAEENGLLAVGGDLCPERLIRAYQLGIFPWFSEGDPILWWFTSPRLVLFPDKIHIPRRLARFIRKSHFSVSYDTAFEQVIGSCASIRKEREEETWITDEMKSAYTRLHHMGYAHSVECWKNNTLVGGLYGVSLGRIFFGESMFSYETNASKVAFVALARLLQQKNYKIIDCQMTTSHLLQFGACEIDGKLFSQYLQRYITTLSPEGHWKNERFPTNGDL